MTPSPLPSPEPVTIRIPSPGKRCPHTGLSRSGLYTLAVPCKANAFRPPVKSFLFKAPGNLVGQRLILWDSLKAEIDRQRRAAEAEAKNAGSTTTSAPSAP